MKLKSLDFIPLIGRRNLRTLRRGVTGLDLHFKDIFDTGVENELRDFGSCPLGPFRKLFKIIQVKDAEDLIGAVTGKRCFLYFKLGLLLTPPEFQGKCFQGLSH